MARRRSNVSKPRIEAFSKPSRVRGRNKRRERYNAEYETFEGSRGRPTYNRNDYRGEQYVY